jgi:hypothetical protein
LYDLAVSSWRPALLVCGPLLALAAFQVETASQAGTASPAASSVTAPRQQFGAAIGDDYFLATYAQLQAYFQTLDRESDRMQLVDIGRTEEGRPQWMAVLSSSDNLRRIDRYREIARRLALAEGLTDDQARALAREGKAIVWIDGGQHADEVLGAQQLIELVYQLASGTDDETTRILNDVIVLAAHANPDGHALVADWYMREPEPARRRLDGVPRLYQKYVGHDNNRDFYMNTQAETVNINRVLYREWFPQIVYNHHQAPPRGTAMFAPPFRGPSNYVFDPLVPASIDLIGAAMHARFAAEGKAGVTMRSGSTYSTWWNGGLRTAAYFHNQIGLLTETTGGPAPGEIPSEPSRQVASADLPYPIAPQRWRFRQSVDYAMTANRAVLDAASRYRETLLFNAYRMGSNAIRRGSEDSWTITPRRQRRDAASRDARAYVLPSDQPDFLTATKFIDALLKSGVAVHRATAPFSAAGRSYPAGSFVVKTAQAFRPHVLDMFEPQDYPDDIPFPGGPPTPPYDSAGWTLAFQMGVRFDRVLDAIGGPFEAIDRVAPPPGSVSGPIGPAPPAGYLLSHRQNDAFVAVNRLLHGGADVWWPADRSAEAMFIPWSAAATAIVARAAADLGLAFTTTVDRPRDAMRIRPVRIGLWDRDGGAVSSGWTRWILERFEFPFDVITPSTVDRGNLAERFDAIILPDDAAVSRMGSISRLKQFIEAGGTAIAIGQAALLAAELGVAAPAPVDKTGGGTPRRLPREQYYVPGSVVRVAMDPSRPVAYGMEPEVDVYFDNSPVFTLTSIDARRLGWFASSAPLRSGWAWGQQHLNGTVAMAEASIGRGRLIAFGPQVTFRAQSHGTFKLLFNALLTARATSD